MTGESSHRDNASGGSSLYVEMLPLVEAGATVEQAARRFGGDAGEAEEIAAGFRRWWDAEGTGDLIDDDDDNSTDDEAVDDADPLVDARRRIAQLEADNRALQRRLNDLREVVRRASELVDTDY